MAAQDEIVTTNRLILVLSGRFDYRLEDRRFRFDAGTQFFVPAWVRRVSRVAFGERCEAIWCEFDLEGDGLDSSTLSRRKLDRPARNLEVAAYRRLLALWSVQDNPWRDLQIEAELKAMLGRFWPEAALPAERSRGSKDDVHIHRAVKDALRWLVTHYGEPDALDQLYAHADVSPNYLRLQFQSALSCSPGTYLQRLRLRQARYLLQETSLPQKQVAAMVGYADPLYFSRLYRRFWGKPPGEGRRSGA